MSSPFESTVPPQPSLLPLELLSRWSRTRILIAITAWCGIALAAVLATTGLLVGLLSFGIAKATAGSALLLFLAAIAFSPCWTLVRQSRAIRKALATRAFRAAEDVLEQQIHYWKFLCTWALVTTVFVLAFALFVAWVNRTPNL